MSFLRKNPPEPKTFIPNFKDENPKQDNNIPKENVIQIQDNSLIKSSEPIIKQKEDPIKPIETITITEKTIDKVIEEPHQEIMEIKEKEEIEKEENINQAETELQADEESSDEDDDGWINPDNFSQHFFTSQKVDEKDNTLGIAIMTADFAMQVLIRNEKIYLFSFNFNRMSFSKSESLYYQLMA